MKKSGAATLLGITHVLSAKKGSILSDTLTTNRYATPATRRTDTITPPNMKSAMIARKKDLLQHAPKTDHSAFCAPEETDATT